MPQIRIAVLGAARIARTKVIPSAAGADRYLITAIATQRLDADERQALARQLAVDVVHGYETVLDDEEVDAVYIPLPNHLHVPWALAAVSAGKHVLCEKPIAMNAAEARRLATAADAAGVVVMEGFMYRFHPMWQQIHDVLHDTIGPLVAVHSWFSYFNDNPTDIRNRAAFGGGALMDIGCYSVNLSRWLFGAEPHTVAATSSLVADIEGADVDTLTSGLLAFDAGQATFTCATRGARDQGARIHGVRGHIEVPTPFSIDPELPASFTVVVDGRRSTYETAEVNAFGRQFESFAEAITHVGAKPVPLTDSVANMDVIDRIVAGRSVTRRT